MSNYFNCQVNGKPKVALAIFGCETIYLDLRGNRVDKAEARKVMTIYRDPDRKATHITLAFL